MEPASRIIKILGGEIEVAKVTGTATTAPYRWQYSRENGGTDGRIPGKHIPLLLARAKELGIDLSANDFYGVIEDVAGASAPQEAA